LQELLGDQIDKTSDDPATRAKIAGLVGAVAITDGDAGRDDVRLTDVEGQRAMEQ
jgi:hypothetical protein